MAAAVQRKAIEDELQRFTLRVTRRTVPIIFSMMLVETSERRNCAGRPSLLTVRIQSNPSRMLFETPGASRSRLSWNQHPEPTGSRRATPLLLFQFLGAIPRSPCVERSAFQCLLWRGAYSSEIE